MVNQALNQYSWRLLIKHETAAAGRKEMGKGKHSRRRGVTLYDTVEDQSSNATSCSIRALLASIHKTIRKRRNRSESGSEWTNGEKEKKLGKE